MPRGGGKWTFVAKVKKESPQYTTNLKTVTQRRWEGGVLTGERGGGGCRQNTKNLPQKRNWGET